MGFNNFYVDLCVNSKTIYNYEKLGYIMPKKYNKQKNIMVYDTSKTVKIHINDLSPNSSVKIDYLCDNCGKSVDVSWRRYLQYNLDGKYYCKECKHNNPKFIKWLKPRKKTSKSRSSSEYNIFVRTVLKRDHFTCQCCGIKKQKNDLQIHHLNGYSWFIEGRTDQANGITLCDKCHCNFHSLYGIVRNTKEQFEEWINRKLKDLNKYDEIPEFPKVYCVEDDIIYNNIYECANKLNCSNSYIYQMCHGTKRTYKGKHYVYYDNYLKMSEEDIKKLFSDNIKRKSIINIEFGNYFNTANDACEKYSIKDRTNMDSCCAGRRKHAGKYKDVKLSWMWYDDYLKLPDNEKINLIEKHLETLEKESFLMQQYNILNKKIA